MISVGVVIPGTSGFDKVDQFQRTHGGIHVEGSVAVRARGPSPHFRITDRRRPLAVNSVSPGPVGEDSSPAECGINPLYSNRQKGRQQHLARDGPAGSRDRAPACRRSKTQ